MMTTTQERAAPIQAMVKQFFAANGIMTRTIYRTCSEAFGDSLGGNCPGNLIPKKAVPSRVTIFLDFKDPNVRLDNFRKIVAFPESIAADLPLHPQWRPGVKKVDLDALPKQYIFRNWDDLKTNYSRIFDT